MESFKLRDYQIECVNSVMETIKTKRRVGVVLCTGAGKTEIFIEICKQYLKDNPLHSILIASHLSLLTTQTTRRFADREPSINVGVLQAQTFPMKSDSVIITTMQSSSDADKISRLVSYHPKKVGMIVIDECHYLYNDSYDKLISYFPDALVVGFTATPFRQGKLMTNFFEKIACSIPMSRLIDEGWIIKPEIKSIKLIDDSTSGRIAQVVKTYKEIEDGKKAVVYMQTQQDANDCRNAFSKEGIKSASILCNINGTIRDGLLNNFKNGDLNVLTTVNVLSMGFDAPCLEVIFMPYSTTSPTLFMQRIGRSLRPYPGKDGSRVYCVGHSPRVQKEYYEKIFDAIAKGNDILKDCKDAREELEIMELIGETDGEQYLWTKNIVDISNKLASIGANVMADMIVSHEFPRIFMNDITKLIDIIPKSEKYLYTGACKCTEYQTGALTDLGFNNNIINMMTKNEAAVILYMSAQLKCKDMITDKYIITKGKYKGKHITELPAIYKRIVQRKFPYSGIAKLINQYERGE